MSVIKAIYEDATTTVRVNGRESKAFSVRVGVHQGSVLSPLLFIIILEALSCLVIHWLPIKQRIDYKICLLTYKTLTNQQPTYLYNSLSFPSHSVSTRSSDSLVLSIPYVGSSLGKRAFSVIGPRLWNSLPPDTLILQTRLLYQYSVPDSKHTSSKLRSLPRLLPISLDCLPRF